MIIGIIDCGGANLNSIYYSFKRLGINTVISSSKDELSDLDAYVLPGVGSANAVMQCLKDNSLIDFIKNITKPVLGICIGMQIMYEYSEEGDTQCLGIINGKIKKFKSEKNLTVPQMGWNKLVCHDDLKSLNGHYYYANSFYTDSTDSAMGYTEYGVNYTSLVKKNNFIGCQFHPEKSSVSGEKFLQYFLTTA